MKGLELHDLQIIFIIFWYERVTFILHDVPFHMYTTVFLPNKCLSTSVHLHFLPPTPTSSLICFLVLLYPLILFSSQSNPYKQVIIKQRYDYVKLQFKCLQWLPTAFRIKCPKRQPARPYMTTPGHHSSLTSPCHSFLLPQLSKYMGFIWFQEFTELFLISRILPMPFPLPDSLFPQSPCDHLFIPWVSAKIFSQTSLP